METKDLRFIEKRIGYTFSNSDLLQQAFIRRSYAQENGGEDNEILEFIGDKVLDMVVVRFLTDKYGFFLSECDDYDPGNDCNEFACEYSEDGLTEFKKHLVEKKMLAHRIDLLGFADYLIMGQGDQRNHVETQESVKEDLFEAILGAVALDCQWNFEKLEEVVENMLEPSSELPGDDDINYIQEIQNWTLKSHHALPEYELIHKNQTVLIPPDGSPKKTETTYIYSLRIGPSPLSFCGLGPSHSAAKKEACKQAYYCLKDRGLLFTIQDEIPNPSWDMSINQLETLARRGYFSIPTYYFSQEYDPDGNPVWYVECHIKEYDTYFYAESSSKKEAKKEAAYEMLRYVLDLD